MDKFQLSAAPISLKLFLTSFLCLSGLVYLVLLIHIWIDTAMVVDNIAKAYGTFDFNELVDHSRQFLPYYGIFIFLIPTLLFLFTSYDEKLKSFFAIFIPAVIVVDVGSMWLIRYVHAGIFSWALFFAGALLGFSFLSLFLLTLYDIWLKKED